MIRRVLRVALLIAIVAVPLWWGYGLLNPQTDRALRAQRPAWTRCPGSLDMECASVKVPLDHHAPEEDTIDLALARLPARHPDQRIGSLVLNFGGPGVSGVSTFLADPEPFNTLRSRYDIVTFDPRGVGKSTPLNCRSNGRPPPYLAVDQTPDTPPELAALVKARNEYAAACVRQGGALLPNLTTEATARDLDLLRSVLGENRLSFLGYSYGGGLGADYAQLYPGRVGRMVLDAPSASAGGGPTDLDAGYASDEGIKAFVVDCVKRKDCPLGRDVDLALDHLKDLVQNRDGLPIEVTGGTLGDALAAQGVFESLYSTDFWPDLRRALADALDGDGQALYDAAMEYEEPAGYSRDAATAISCNDTSSRPEPENIMEQARIARENAPISGSWQIWGSIQCQGWDTVAGSMWWGDPPPQLTPIMIVGTVGDPVVPYEDVKNLRSTLSGSVMVTLQGNSHTAYRAGDRCVNDTVEAFLLDGVVPGADVECPAAGTGER
ncbi:alpha/beta hydrolase [Nonomuraea insulae]|uniref:Alpha/beta hydrolase n=1 Tax=Nonomuraea insulae TaxID=1616787 RepID=A0ABW1D4S9_9ACTN